MKKKILSIPAAIAIIALVSACATNKESLLIDLASVFPGTQVAKKGEKFALIGEGINVGQRLSKTSLVDMKTMQEIDLREYQGDVLFLSIVPSVDTKVCEAQTHYLGEEGDVLPSTVKRIVISRDTPFAQARFSKEAKLEDVQYLSDYKEGAFGRSTGLLIDGSRLLARSVLIVDKQGVVRYIQVVPDITHLPDMDKAFATAVDLDAKP